MDNSKRHPVLILVLMLALAAALGIGGMLLPVGGALLVVLMPAPVAVLLAKRQFIPGMLVLAVEGLAMVLGGAPPALVAVVLFPVAVGSVVLGIMIQKRRSMGRTIFWGALALLVAVVVAIIPSQALLGMSPGEVLAQITRGFVELLRQFYALIGISADTVEDFSEAWNRTLSSLVLYLPTVLVVLMGLISLVNFYLARTILGFSGEGVPEIPAFRQWRFSSPVMFGGLFIGVISVALKNFFGFQALFPLGANLYFFFYVAFFVQGLATLDHFMVHYKLPQWSRMLINFLVFIVQPLPFVVSWLGMLDGLFNYRSGGQQSKT